MLTRGAEYSLSRIRVSLSHSSPSLVTARLTARRSDFRRGGCSGELFSSDLVRRPWWWSFSSPLVLLNSWWSWLVDARVRCCHGEDGEAWWLRHVGAGSRRWWCVVRRSLRDSDLFLAAGGARRMVECSRCCCRCGGEKMVLRELAVVENDGTLLWLCARRWNCGGVAAATDGGAGTRGEDYVKVLPWWFSSVFRRGQVRKMVAQGAVSWWWRERWRRRCCANGGKWWRCHGEARWWSENKLPWWLTEMAAAAAVEGGHGG